MLLVRQMPRACKIAAWPSNSSSRTFKTFSACQSIVVTVVATEQCYCQCDHLPLWKMLQSCQGTDMCFQNICIHHTQTDKKIAEAMTVRIFAWEPTGELNLFPSCSISIYRPTLPFRPASCLSVCLSASLPNLSLLI